jgi:hypothetical protein
MSQIAENDGPKSEVWFPRQAIGVAPSQTFALVAQCRIWPIPEWQFQDDEDEEDKWTFDGRESNGIVGAKATFDDLQNQDICTS